MKLRPATMGDAEMLLAWRNDPLTREMSHNTEAVELSGHLAWLNAVISNPARRLYIAEEHGVAVGTVRADTNGGATELSWTVAPNARGRGVGRAMVALVATNIPGPITAKVKTLNAASVRIAEAAGMVHERTVGEVAHFARR